jgi:alcohol dehydrogenase/propanol-preferring alcohol dehydrogenase
MPALGHRNIITLDISDSKKEAALAEGANHFVKIDQDNVAQSVIDVAAGKVAAVLDFVNSSETALAAFDMLRKGGTMVQVGLFGGDLVAPLPILTLQLLSIRGTLTGTIEELQEVIDLAKKGKLKPVPIERMNMNDANAAIGMMEKGQVTGRYLKLQIRWEKLLSRPCDFRQRRREVAGLSAYNRTMFNDIPKK